MQAPGGRTARPQARAGGVVGARGAARGRKTRGRRAAFLDGPFVVSAGLVVAVVGANGYALQLLPWWSAVVLALLGAATAVGGAARLLRRKLVTGVQRVWTWWAAGSSLALLGYLLL